MEDFALKSVSEANAESGESNPEVERLRDIIADSNAVLTEVVPGEVLRGERSQEVEAAARARAIAEKRLEVELMEAA